MSKDSRCEKRPFDENTSGPNKKKTYSNKSLTVTYSTYSAKEQECLVLQSEVARYKQEWMRKFKFFSKFHTTI